MHGTGGTSKRHAALMQGRDTVQFLRHENVVAEGRTERPTSAKPQRGLPDLISQSANTTSLDSIGPTSKSPTLYCLSDCSCDIRRSAHSSHGPTFKPARNGHRPDQHRIGSDSGLSRRVGRDMVDEVKHDPDWSRMCSRPRDKEHC